MLDRSIDESTDIHMPIRSAYKYMCHVYRCRHICAFVSLLGK